MSGFDVHGGPRQGAEQDFLEAFFALRAVPTIGF